jgi:hypothetical protein
MPGIQQLFQQAHSLGLQLCIKVTCTIRQPLIAQTTSHKYSSSPERHEHHRKDEIFAEQGKTHAGRRNDLRHQQEEHSKTDKDADGQVYLAVTTPRDKEKMI